jgi:hypothetical protein
MGGARVKLVARTEVRISNMNLTPGEIYFIGEIDSVSGEQSPYVKIGIVRQGGQADRTSFDRLLEHQTGNPRKLRLIDQVSADAVEAIETTLHHMYAPYRVYGEWMQFTAEQLENVKRHARDLAGEMRDLKVLFEQAEKLGDVESGDGKIPADIDAEHWFTRHQTAKLLADKCSDAIDSYKAMRIKQAEQGEDVQAYIAVQQKAGRKKFDVEAFKAAHPDIFEKFSVSTSRIKGSFRPTVLKEIDEAKYPLDNEVTNLINDLVARSTSPSPNEDHSELHDLFLKVKSQMAYADWEKEISAVQIKILCGYAEGIEGICSWKRTNVVEVKLDEKALREAHPQLVEKFTSVAESTKAYALESKVAPK